MTTYRTLMALVVLVASPAFAQSQRRDNPTAKDTLRWMQTSLESGSGDYWVGHETRSVRLEDFAGCKVHFSASTHQQPFANGEPAPDKKPTRIDYFFELGDIDPANITFSKGQDSGTEVPSFITIRTRNDEKKITSRYSWEPEVGAKADDTFVIFAVEAFGSDNDYVVRFATAFKRAVEACGGKPSLFADSDRRDERVHTAPDGVAVQSKPHRKDIATIAKEANGAVVSIVMSDKEGHPIAQGSGFLISKDGWVVTNYHVIKSGSSAVVKLPDGAFFPVDGIVASDKGRDVAIIKAHGNDFRTLTFGDSARLQVGEEVVAIGNPLSLESTVSNGIVSAIRTVEEEGGKFLQITAPISHGSSGGPLLNMAGEVVGITSAVIMGGENLNFAIPIDDVKSMIGSSVSKVRSGAGVGSALPDEAEDEKNNPPKFDQTKLTYKDTKPYAFKADCSVVGNVESCAIFNELAGNEDSELFAGLSGFYTESIACFMSPESINNVFESKRFYVFSLNTFLGDIMSRFAIYDNGTLGSLEFFYLVPSLLDDGFKVTDTGNGGQKFSGELSREDFSYAHMNGVSSDKILYGFDVNLFTGRMTQSLNLGGGHTTTYGRCFSYTNPRMVTKGTDEERKEVAATIEAEVAANNKARDDQNKRDNDCMLNYYKQLCRSCSDDQIWNMIADAVKGRGRGPTMARDPTLESIAKKCENGGRGAD